MSQFVNIFSVTFFYVQVQISTKKQQPKNLRLDEICQDTSHLRNPATKKYKEK